MYRYSDEYDTNIPNIVVMSEYAAFVGRFEFGAELSATISNVVSYHPLSLLLLLLLSNLIIEIYKGLSFYVPVDDCFLSKYHKYRYHNFVLWLVCIVKFSTSKCNQLPTLFFPFLFPLFPPDVL